MARSRATHGPGRAGGAGAWSAASPARMGALLAARPPGAPEELAAAETLLAIPLPGAPRPPDVAPR
jgi:hypothetical protein